MWSNSLGFFMFCPQAIDTDLNRSKVLLKSEIPIIILVGTWNNKWCFHTTYSQWIFTRFVVLKADSCEHKHFRDFFRSDLSIFQFGRWTELTHFFFFSLSLSLSVRFTLDKQTGSELFLMFKSIYAHWQIMQGDFWCDRKSIIVQPN